MTLILKRFSKLIAWVLAGLIALFAIYSALGFWWAPGWVQSRAEQFVHEKLDRQLLIEKIEINPLTFSVRLEGVKLTEPKGDGIFASFDALAVDVSVRSVFRAAPVIKNIQLTNPYVHVIRTKDNQYNFDDFLALANESGADAEPGKEADKEPAKYAIHNIQLDNGRIEFNDIPKKKKHVVEDLMIGIPFISTMPSDVKTTVNLLLSAKINGTATALTADMTPFSTEREMTARLQLTGINLPAYMQYLPFTPQFKLPQGKLNTDLMIHFLQPENKAPELMISGSFRLDSFFVTGLDNTPLLRLQGLEVSLDKSSVLAERYQVARISITQPEVFATRGGNGEWNLASLANTGAPDKKKEKSTLQLTMKQLAIQNGKITYKDFSSPYLLSATVDKWNLTTDNTVVDMKKNEVSVGQVGSSSANVDVVSRKRTRGGEGAERAGNRRKASQAAHPSGSTNNSPPLAVRIGKLDVGGWSIRHENHQLAKPVVTTVAPLSVRLNDLSSTPGSMSRLAVNATINKKGSIAVEGDVGFSPYYANLSLNVKDVDVRGAQSYIDEYVNLFVRRASLSAKGVLEIGQGKKNEFQGQYKGSLSVDNLWTVDQISKQSFLGWKRLSLEGINTRIVPLSVSINQISLDGLQARIILSPEGRFNFQDILRSHAGGQKSLTDENGEKTKPAASEATVPAQRRASGVAVNMPVHIEKFRMRNGKIRFTDNYIKPHYTANLLGLKGSVSGLSSNQESTAQVDVRGEVYGAPLTIAGTINPFRENLFLDIQAHIKGMDLTQLSVYSAKYAGYGIEKGKLSFDVSYRLEDNTLTAQNRLILDQLTFGERVDSPTATKLPVQFALALLKDSNGVVDINLPVQGSLNDPEFSLGGVIWKLITGLITKVVTSPFSFLSSLAGDSGKELSWLEFEPGSRLIPEKGKAQLTTLAKALTERPAIKLEITGRFDPEEDKHGLSQASIQRKVRALKRSDLEAQGNKVSMTQVTVSDSEYPALLARVYKNEGGGTDELTGLPKNASVYDMEKALVAYYKASEDDLIFLGNQRAEAVKDWLIKQGNISPDRIFIIASKNGQGKEGVRASRVDFSLR